MAASMTEAGQEAAMLEAATKAEFSANLGYYLGPFLLG